MESPWWNTQHIKITKDIIQQDSSINNQITLTELQLVIEQSGKNKSVPNMIQYEHFKFMDQDSLIKIVKLYNKVLQKGELFNQRNGLTLNIETDIKNPSKTVFSTNISGIHLIKLHQLKQTNELNSSYCF